MLGITRILFVIADILAWLIVGISLFGCVLYPIAAPGFAKMDRVPISDISIVVTCVEFALVAAGAFAIIRRRVLGLLFVALPVWIAAFSGQYLAATIGLCMVAAVFGTLFALVYLQARHTWGKQVIRAIE